METLEKVLALYREKCFDFNVRHFQEKLSEKHRIQLSYTWVKLALQGAGLVKKRGRRGTHRRRRPRRPLPGMLLHIDASKHAWFQDGRYYDLITILDDATSEIYYAQLVEEEGTRTLMPAVREVVETQGVFCALYSDRASHFFVTPKAGGKVDLNQVTQLGRALQELGIQMIPAYSPQARGRMERSYRTWQGRLPQELRIRNIRAVAEANRSLREEYRAEFNRRFAVPAAAKGSAFVRTRRADFGAAWSPDGRSIAFVSQRAGRSQIWVCDHNGTGLRQLTPVESNAGMQPRWSPDGEWIAFPPPATGISTSGAPWRHRAQTDGRSGR